MCSNNENMLILKDIRFSTIGHEEQYATNANVATCLLIKISRM